MSTLETELQATERLLREKLAQAQAAERAARPRSPLAGLLQGGRLLLRRRKPAPAKPDEAGGADDALEELFSMPAAAGRTPALPLPDVERQKRNRRSDFIMATLGMALGLTCAVFPWYIFFNQEQFGVQAMKFGGKGGNAGRSVAGYGLDSGGATPDEQALSPDLDPFATGTLQSTPMRPQDAPGLDRQPFPAEVPAFRLVHVANGRAMIEDDAGLWVVQPGSVLPDASRVRAIEKRNGRWVLLTSADSVLEMTK
ncbi:hypothetical protein ACTDI4_18790 [Mesorhizobium sp. PUT5]|uniref:hypothetical protein n=1 Tax=Mesorhizobium sp. PUT5 TaxID=3454629 RepID=UPI003FA4139A